MKPFLCLVALGLALLATAEVTAGLSESLILSCMTDAKKLVDDAYTYSRAESIRRVRRGTPSPSDLLRLVRQPSRQARSAVRARDYMDNTLRLIQERHHHIHKRSLNATDLLTQEQLDTIAALTGCSARRLPPTCDSDTVNKYRTASSICNNRADPRRGSSNMPLTRWLPSEYQDGISLPIGWDPDVEVNGHLLPLVRQVSNHIMEAKNQNAVNDTEFTYILTFFGQFMDHDLSFTPHSPTIRSFNSGINCDDTCERTEPCFPIGVPPNDTRLSTTECIPFFRSAPACGTGNNGFVFGAVQVREQLNTLTSFIDAGQVYGSEDGLARELRDLDSTEGLLLVNSEYNDNGRELLPFVTSNANMCANRQRITGDSSAEEVPCFLTGDVRADENLALSSVHTMMMREHNRLARALHALNPHWSSETIYQEARKIVGAYLQVLTFRDYLPIIVGPDAANEKLGLYPGYDENVDPSISNVFATGAFRFAHLTLQPFIFRLDENYEQHPDYSTVLLHRAFFTPWRVLFEGGVDPVLRGLLGKPAKLNTQDHMLIDEVRERLFEFLGHIALDLAALNMQRGRDHGIPGYNAWRGFCGLSQPKNVEELAVVLNNTNLAQNLWELYGTADNIDVWLGGVAEPFVPGARVGELFACLISNQFSKIREGDRFWWENEGIFTEKQRRSLRRASLARIICDNTAISDVPEHPFFFRPRGSGYTPCADIPKFDLRPWREDPPEGDSSDNSSETISTKSPDSRRHAAFSVRLGQNDPKPGRPIAFKDIVYNRQRLYNTRNGKFTCQEAGVYRFDFHLIFNNSDGSVDLRLNGKSEVRVVLTKQNGLISASGGTILQLAEGDEVFLTANFDGNGLVSDSVFSGNLLFQA